MDNQPSGAGGSGNGFGWRKLLAFSAFGAALVILLATVLIFKSADPPFIVMFFLFSAGGILALRPGKMGVTGTVMAALAAGMFTSFGGPFAVALFQTPETREIIPVTAALFLSLTILVSAIVLAIKGKGRAFEPSTAAKILGAAALVLILSVSAWNTYLLATYESESAQAADIRLVTSDFEFRPKALSAEGGTVSVHVTNRDETLHTFTIESLGVDVSVPGGRSARVSFQAAPGDYDFICEPHAPDMRGKLTVS